MIYFPVVFLAEASWRRMQTRGVDIHGYACIHKKQGKPGATNAWTSDHYMFGPEPHNAASMDNSASKARGRIL